MKSKSIIIGLAFLMNIGCNNFKPENNMNTADTTKQILIRQLQAGRDKKYGEDDLNATVNFLDSVLAKKGYTKISKEAFASRIQQIFHRTVDWNSLDNCLYINFDEPCDMNIVYYPATDSASHPIIYVSKKSLFITRLYPLPTIMDYAAIYPDVLKYETGSNPSPLKWKDISDLKGERERNVDLVLYRNKYLFNNDTASLTWLINNDIDFLDLLVRKFGYDKDSIVNKAVLAKVQKQYADANYSSNGLLENLFAAKDCSGQLQIREGLLKTVADETNANHNELFDMLENYCLNLASGEKDIPFNFTYRSKIIACICNTTYPLYVKYKGKGGEATWDPGSLLLVIKGNYSKIIDEIVKNNYFGYSNLKRYIDEATQQYNQDTSKPDDDDTPSDNSSNRPTSLILHSRPDFGSFSREVAVKGEVEYLHNISGWDFVKVGHDLGYIPTEQAIKEKAAAEKSKRSFLADEDDIKPEKKKGFWGNLFG